jgi:hypothetical protein
MTVVYQPDPLGLAVLLFLSAYLTDWAAKVFSGNSVINAQDELSSITPQRPQDLRLGSDRLDSPGTGVCRPQGAGPQQ